MQIPASGSGLLARRLPPPGIRLEAARDQICLLERDYREQQSDLQKVRSAQKLSLKAALPLALLAAGSLALGYSTAAVAGGLLAGVCAFSGLLALRLAGHNERKIAEYAGRLEKAEVEMQEAHRAVHGKYTPDYEVKLLASQVRTAGGVIAHSEGLIQIGGVRLRTRG